MMHFRRIVAARSDGFGERMCALLNAMFISRKIGLEFGFVWEKSQTPVTQGYASAIRLKLPNEEIACEEIFGQDFILEHRVANIPMLEGHSFVVWKDSNLDILLTLEPPYDWGWYAPQSDLTFFFPSLNRDEYYKGLREAWSGIQFSQPLQALQTKVEAFLEEHPHFHAFHLRGGDIVHERVGQSKWLWFAATKGVCLPLALGIIIQQIVEGETVILFGDCLETNQLICHIIKTTIYPHHQDIGKIYLVDELYDQQNYNEIEQTFFEAVLLSKAKKIISSGESGFSRLACFIGECEVVRIYRDIPVLSQLRMIIQHCHYQNINLSEMAFSCFHLYRLSKLLLLGNQMQIDFLQAGLVCDWGNDVFRLCIIDVLLRQRQYKLANETLSRFLRLRGELYLETLLAKTHNVKKYNHDLLFGAYLVQDLNLYPSLFLVVGQMVKDFCFHFEEFGEKFGVMHCDVIYGYLKSIATSDDGAMLDNPSIQSMKPMLDFLSKNNVIFQIKMGLPIWLGLHFVTWNKTPSFWRFLSRAFVIIYEHRKINNILHSIGIVIDPSISDEVASMEAKKILNHLSYRMGSAFVKNPFTFFFKAKKIYRDFKASQL